MKMILAGLGLMLAGSVAGSAAAVAADMPVKAPVAAAPLSYNWTGIYLGGYVGGSWGTRATTHDPCPVPSINPAQPPCTGNNRFTASPPVSYELS